MLRPFARGLVRGASVRGASARGVPSVRLFPAPLRAPLPMRSLSSMASDLFVVLDVEKHASKAQIKQQFYKKAKMLHPDVMFSGDMDLDESQRRRALKRAEAQFVELTHAYEVLSDPKKRALYIMQHEMAKRRQQRDMSDFRHSQYYSSQSEQQYNHSKYYTERKDTWGGGENEWGWGSGSKKKDVRASQEYFDGTQYQSYPGLAKRGRNIFEELRREYDEALVHAYHGPLFDVVRLFAFHMCLKSCLSHVFHMCFTSNLLPRTII